MRDHSKSATFDQDFYFYGHILSDTYERVHVLCTRRETGPILTPNQRGTRHHLTSKIVCRSGGDIMSHFYIKKFKHPIMVPFR